MRRNSGNAPAWFCGLYRFCLAFEGLLESIAERDKVVIYTVIACSIMGLFFWGWQGVDFVASVIVACTLGPVLGFVIVVFIVILLNLLLLAGRLANTFCTGIANIAGWGIPWEFCDAASLKVATPHPRFIEVPIESDAPLCSQSVRRKHPGWAIWLVAGFIFGSWMDD